MAHSMNGDAECIPAEVDCIQQSKLLSEGDRFPIALNNVNGEIVILDSLGVAVVFQLHTQSRQRTFVEEMLAQFVPPQLNSGNLVVDY